MAATWAPPRPPTPTRATPSFELGDWDRVIGEVFAEAGLRQPDGVPMQSGGRRGLHGEGLGHLLAEMQSLARAHPGAVW